jgi:hypothetical protein
LNVKVWSVILVAFVLVHSDDVPFADWMMSLQRPDVGGPCCGPADQFYVDDYEVDPDGDGFVAHIAGEEKTIHIPANKVIWDRVNPTGRGVLFRSLSMSGYIYCFVPGSGV